MWKAWPHGSAVLNIVFWSFHYDLLGAYNLQRRSVLPFKEIEVHSHLQSGKLFLYAPLEAICFSNLFYLLGALATNLKWENLCGESERDANSLAEKVPSRCLWATHKLTSSCSVAREDCGDAGMRVSHSSEPLSLSTVSSNSSLREHFGSQETYKLPYLFGGGWWGCMQRWKKNPPTSSAFSGKPLKPNLHPCHHGYRCQLPPMSASNINSHWVNPQNLPLRDMQSFTSTETRI